MRDRLLEWFGRSEYAIIGVSVVLGLAPFAGGFAAALLGGFAPWTPDTWRIVYLAELGCGWLGAALTCSTVGLLIFDVRGALGGLGVAALGVLYVGFWAVADLLTGPLVFVDAPVLSVDHGWVSSPTGDYGTQFHRVVDVTLGTPEPVVVRLWDVDEWQAIGDCDRVDLVALGWSERLVAATCREP